MRKLFKFFLLGFVFGLAAFLSGCSALAIFSTPTPTPEPSATPTPQPSATHTLTTTERPTLIRTSTITLTPTASLSPTTTETPTITSTPTRVPITVTVKEQANCRYGPGTAYLYRWGLYPNDSAQIDGKNWNGTWFWILPYNLDSHCWASEIVFTETVDKASIPIVNVPLPKTTFAGPPGNVQAVRAGDKVTVSWNEVPLIEDKRRGYLLEVTTCYDGSLLYTPIHTDDTSITFTDMDSCSSASGGLLYTAEKHGYSDPVTIPWP